MYRVKTDDDKIQLFGTDESAARDYKVDKTILPAEGSDRKRRVGDQMSVIFASLPGKHSPLLQAF
jgi:hypothetical protein